MAIRPVQSCDTADIQAIYNASKLDELINEPGPFQLLPLQEDHPRRQALEESTIYVYEQQQKVIAYGAHLRAEITALFVSPKARGQQIGKQMLEHLLSCITGRAYLSVAQSNTTAKALYHHYGFHTEKTFKTEYNGVPVLAETMVRHIE